MNTALRIASVTYVLKDLLNNKMIDHNVSGGIGVNVMVTALSPDKIDTSADNEQSQLNLFMYHATINQGWRNVALPSFNGNGNRINNPPLAIDLHYLLTAYGSQELHTDILLGYGMQLFHETPVLDRKAINKSIATPIDGNLAALPPSLRTLSDSALADQIEMITITPETLSVEDISKLWAAFATKYRPTAAYKATVVLIESDKSFKVGPPVQTRNIYTIPLKKPLIENVLSRSAIEQPMVEDQQILDSYFIVIKGHNLYDENARVMIDGIPVPNTSKLEITDTKISFQLTDDLNLQAGSHTVKVIQETVMGNDPENAPTHPGTASEPVSFILAPKITDITPQPLTIPPNESADITITVSPKLYPGQKIALLLNAVAAEANGIFRSYSFQKQLPGLSSDPKAIPVNNITIPVSGVLPQKYLARIQVDGINSAFFPIPTVYDPQILTVQ